MTALVESTDISTLTRASHPDVSGPPWTSRRWIPRGCWLLMLCRRSVTGIPGPRCRWRRWRTACSRR